MRMLIITIYNMSNVIAKSHQDHQGSQNEQLWTLMTFQGGVSVSSNKRPLVGFDSWLRHNAFRKPGLRTFRLPYHVTALSQWDWNPAFTVHAECYIAHAFRTAIKLTQCRYQGCAEEGWTRRRPPTSKAMCHPEWNYEMCIYHNLITRPGVQHILWMLVARSYF